MDPATVPTLSDNIAFSISFTLPLESTFPATLATEVNVPAVSKKSTKKSVNTTVTIPADKAAPISNVRRCFIGGIDPTTPLNLASPQTQALILNTNIPIMILPLIFSFSKTIIVTNAKHANKTIGSFKLPSVTNVTG